MHADLAHELTNLRFDRKELNAKSEWEKVGEGSFGHVYKVQRCISLDLAQWVNELPLPSTSEHSERRAHRRDGLGRASQ